MAFLHKITKTNSQNDRNHTYFISHRHDFITQTRKKKGFYREEKKFMTSKSSK